MSDSDEKNTLCPCGSSIKKTNLKAHQKTKKCMVWHAQNAAQNQPVHPQVIPKQSHKKVQTQQQVPDDDEDEFDDEDQPADDEEPQIDVDEELLQMSDKIISDLIRVNATLDKNSKMLESLQSQINERFHTLTCSLAEQNASVMKAQSNSMSQLFSQAKEEYLNDKSTPRSESRP